MSRQFRALVPALLLVTSSACRPPHDAHPGRSLGIDHYPAARDLYAVAEAYRAKHELPALGIGIIHQGRIVGLGMHPGYAGATLELLLRHRSGLSHEMNRNDRWTGWQRAHSDDSPREQRLAFTTAAIQRPPQSPPGTAASYSSDGYIVAGSMLERLAGQDWAPLVHTLLFEPLGLQSMRYGLATPVSGHETGWFGRSLAIPPDPSEYGLQPFGAPAGFLQATVPDLLRYLDFHIQGERGHGTLLPQVAVEHLHDAVGQEPYALGWESEVRRDAQGRVVEHSVYHGGYSGRFRANLWFVPETQWGTAIVMNSGRGDDTISSDVFYGLLRDFGLVAGPDPQ